MKTETRSGILLMASELTDSVIRIERHADDQVMVSLAARDGAGQMGIESAQISIEDLIGLADHPDDDGLEVTKEWLEQTEFVNPSKEATECWVDPNFVWVTWSNEVFSLYYKKGGDWLCHNPTRGDVRQVIKTKQLWNRKR